MSFGSIWLRPYKKGRCGHGSTYPENVMWNWRLGPGWQVCKPRIASQPAGAGGQGQLYPHSLRGNQPWPHLELRRLTSRLWDNTLLWFKPLSLCILLQQPELAQEDSSIRVRTGGEKKLLERMLKEHSLSASCKWRFSTQAALPVSASLSLALLVPHLPHPSPSPGKPALYNPNQLGSNKPDKTERRDHIPEPWKR